MEDEVIEVPLGEVTDPLVLLRHLVRETRRTKEEIMGALDDVKQVAADFAAQIQQEVAKVQASLDDTIAGLTGDNEALQIELQARADELAAISTFAQEKSAELQADDPVVEPEPEPEPEPEVPVELEPEVVVEPKPEVAPIRRF